MLTTIRNYWRARWAERTSAIVLLAMALGFITMQIVLKDLELVRYGVGLFCGVLGMLIMNVVCFGRRADTMTVLLIAGLLCCSAGPGQAQEQLPGYTYDSWSTLETSLNTDVNLPPQDKVGIIPVVICVGVAVGVVGYVAVKIISACLKVHENQVTNNQQGEFPLPLQEEPPVPGWVSLPSPTAPAACQCSVLQPAAGQPLPLAIEHSFDRDIWTPVSYGIAVSQELQLPDTGYWRARPLFVRLEKVGDTLTVHAPPGVLEHSSDLKEWREVSRSFSDTQLPAEPGFYRVRLN